MTVGSDFVLTALAEEGLTHLFMVPGGLVDPFLPALARVPRLRPIVAAHEGGAAYMADGYARASGRFGAVLGIGGPGLTNMMTAVAAAKTDGSPVLVLSGEIPLDMEGLGEFQDASQTTLDDTALTKPITRLSETVASPRSLDHALRRALTMMWAQPQGPVHLSLTHDALIGATSADYAPISPYFKTVAPLSTPAAMAAIATLRNGPKIAVLAGAGVKHDDAAALLKAVAERWSIPVATTLRAKGVFPEDQRCADGLRARPLSSISTPTWRRSPPTARRVTSCWAAAAHPRADAA
jgi:acetolactate synthase I/II/III large subunit